MKALSTKKILSIILAVVMIMGSLPVFAVPTLAVSEDDLEFYRSGDAYTLDRCDISAKGDLVIPSEYNGLPVTGIANQAFYNCRYLTSVTIPDTVTKIGGMAFLECPGLTSITIPASVTEISFGAFAACENLKGIYVDENNANYKSIDGVLYKKEETRTGLISFPAGNEIKNYTVPDDVTYIDNDAFYGCKELVSVKIPATVVNIGNDAFLHCSSLEGIFVGEGCVAYSSDENGVLFNKDKTILYNYPAGNKSESYVIPSTVEELRLESFYQCHNLKSVVIPDSVTKVGYSVFQECEGLTSITIPGSIKEISANMFYKCTALTSVVISDGVEEIGNSAFDYCSALTSVTIPESVNTIGSAFAGCTSLTAIKLPSAITSISSYLFGECTSLASVTIPSGVTEIEGSAFSNCTSLTELSIPASVTKIGWGAFKGCAALTSIELPDGLTEIPSNAFADCTSLTSVNIPDSVTKISSSAFEGCAALKYIAIPDSVTNIGSEAFGYTGDGYWDSDIGKYIYLKIDGFVMSGSKDSAAQKYAEENEITFISVTGEVTDSTGITVLGELSEGTALTVSELEVTDNGVLFDITLTKNGEAVQPDGAVIVKIPVPAGLDGEACNVYRKEENGTYTDMKAVCDGANLIFTTDHFSEYVVTTENLGVIYGDVNGDGFLTPSDVVLLRRYFANYDSVTGTSAIEVTAGADVNGDGALNPSDVVLLRRYFANYDSETGESTIVLGK